MQYLGGYTISDLLKYFIVYAKIREFYFDVIFVLINGVVQK